MKYPLLATLFGLFSILTLSTNVKAQWNAYYPDGKKINIKFTTINSLKDSLGLFDIEIVSTSYGEVFYKKFTNKPVFVFLNKKEYVPKIPVMLQKYDYGKYLNSYSYYADLKRLMESGKLTKSFLGDVFGYEGSEEEEEDGMKSLTYRKNNAVVYFKGDSAVKVNVINYRSIDLHKTALFDYKVTGENYSIGFDISVVNLTKSAKTIKYIYFTVTATNAVDDKIGTRTVRGIGPIKPGDIGSYNFEDTFYSKTAEYLSLDAIKIQYMDGTIKLLNKSQIQSIKYMDWEEEGNRTLN